MLDGFFLIPVGRNLTVKITVSPVPPQRRGRGSTSVSTSPRTRGEVPNTAFGSLLPLSTAPQWEALALESCILRLGDAGCSCPHAGF